MTVFIDISLTWCTAEYCQYLSESSLALLLFTFWSVFFFLTLTYFLVYMCFFFFKSFTFDSSLLCLGLVVLYLSQSSWHWLSLTSLWFKHFKEGQMSWEHVCFFTLCTKYVLWGCFVLKAWHTCCKSSSFFGKSKLTMIWISFDLYLFLILSLSLFNFFYSFLSVGGFAWLTLCRDSRQ